MLEEKQLAAIALVCAILGIVVLLVISYSIEPHKTSIREIRNEMDGKRVYVEGKNDWAMEREKFVLLTTEQK